LGDYDKVGNFDTLFYPPPYNFRARAIAPPENYYDAARMGLGCSGAACTCGGKCSGIAGLLDDVNWVNVAVFAVGAAILWNGLKGAARKKRSAALVRRVRGH
jgi:hypothetical protein